VHDSFAEIAENSFQQLESAHTDSDTGTELTGPGFTLRSRRGAIAEVATGIWRNPMKMSHLANFLLIIVGGAAQEVASAVRRGLRGRDARPD
jgi:hypothetical protein